MRRVFAIVAVVAALCLMAAAHPAPHGPVVDTAEAPAKRSTLEEQLAAVYCPTRDCTGGRDWLVKTPNAAAGWAVGSVAFLASGNNKYRPRIIGFAMLELGISLFLRAGLNYANGNKRAIYIASLFFNYNAATILFINTLASAIVLKLFTKSTNPDPSTASRIIMSITSLALFAMMLAGIVIMYRDETMVVKNVGWRLIQAVLFIMVILTVPALVMLVISTFAGSPVYTFASLAMLVAAVLMGVWSSFMLARTWLPLDSVARSSEVAFYLLNIAPLLLSGILS
ncbi:hypothetical protein H4R21_004681 [Coemansia helicoidea]|uniref:Uncharacterized protein n=1 Tax=Coemansia helicoidea TaxID=1286919 RepID=A0ACC1KXM8_9FUNG|nr:hypothetical protein H4R21_004681 [Coemansia helicoidea]